MVSHQTTRLKSSKLDKNTIRISADQSFLSDAVCDMLARKCKSVISNGEILCHRMGGK